jgi:hypothetical protein
MNYFLFIIIFILCLRILILRDERKFTDDCIKRRDEDLEYYKNRVDQLLKTERKLISDLEKCKSAVNKTK